MPRGGIDLWCQLPDVLPQQTWRGPPLAIMFFWRACNVFSVSQSMTNFMRFNVSQLESDDVFDVIQHSMSPKPGADLLW